MAAQTTTTTTNPGQTGRSYLGAVPPGGGPGGPTNVPDLVPPQGASLTQVGAMTKQFFIGPALAAILGLDPSKPYYAQDLLVQYGHLSRGQLIQLQTLLSGAGFYTDANGQPSTAGTFGNYDDAGMQAFSDLLAANAGGITNNLDGTPHTLTQTLFDNQGQGATVQTRGQAVIGGNNTYQINLTNPDDIYKAAVTIFQAALGRGPTQAELDRAVKNIQGAQTAEQQAGIDQKEAASQRAYQAQLGQGQAATAPRLNLGPAPAGPISDPAQWAVGFLNYLRKPVTASNVAFIMGLENAAGTGLA